MLFNPFWARHAAEVLDAEQHFETWPRQYGWWLNKWASGLRSMGERPLASQQTGI
jgi:hypothetical protein